ncbi:MAG: cupin domain-containing protein [candidate division Zixibacteria bacterium]|nr:cupin domain-containing protein [candidate division Zixibacteria bacterium]
MKTRILLLALGAALSGIGSFLACDAPPKPTPDATAHSFNVLPEEFKWERIFPEFGERSAEIVILHVDSKTGGAQLMIRVPPNAHVPKHWHTANETHTVMSGTFVMECEGHRQALTAGSFNYVPSKATHEAWTTPTEGALLFITVDAPWDVNWVNGPPKLEDLVGGVSPQR